MSSCDHTFQPFRQALLVGANDDSQVVLQVSPDKGLSELARSKLSCVMFRCTSSPFTKSVVRKRLRDVVLARLADPALYDVSVRWNLFQHQDGKGRQRTSCTPTPDCQLRFEIGSHLAALMRRSPGGDRLQTRRLRTSSQASSPRSVTLAKQASPSQLPSSSTLSIGVIIWYTELLKTSKLIQGTCTPLHHAHAGRTQCGERERAVTSDLKSMSNALAA